MSVTPIKRPNRLVQSVIDNLQKHVDAGDVQDLVICAVLKEGQVYKSHAWVEGSGEPFTMLGVLDTAKDLIKDGID